ncbi:energy transducer TonB [Novosphingobium sp. B 225]|uniref:energy transducer TonB n=1 Tax=Novosphingobium sp. B 225 TaxID=1961849 RepID=UPI000B4B13C6|nr:TonB family protein [Novosphingobium sp. B 225]
MKRTLLFCSCVMIGSPAFGEEQPFANPLSDPFGWVSNADFPADAPADARGHVRYRMVVGQDGKIRNCFAADEFLLDDDGSSRFARLTCDLLRERARYAVPQDAQGRALLGNHLGHIYWYRNQVAAFGVRHGDNAITLVKHALPPLPPTPQERFASLPRLASPIDLPDILNRIPASAVRAKQAGTSIVRLHITAKGQLAACTPVKTSGYARLDRAACKLFARKSFIPARDRSDRAAAFYFYQPVHWRFSDWFRMPVTLTERGGPQIDLAFDYAFLGGVYCQASMAGKRIVTPLSDDICQAFAKTRKREMVPGHTASVTLAPYVPNYSAFPVRN